MRGESIIAKLNRTPRYLQMICTGARWIYFPLEKPIKMVPTLRGGKTNELSIIILRKFSNAQRLHMPPLSWWKSRRKNAIVIRQIASILW